LANGQVEQNPLGPLPPLEQQSRLLRMLRKKTWLEHLAEAFLLRPGETGLSVCFDCTPDQCATLSGLSVTHGAASLTVQSVIGLGLTVQPDGVTANYAQIMGLPDPNDSDDAADQAELMASQLAKVASITDTTRRTN